MVDGASRCGAPALRHHPASDPADPLRRANPPDGHLPGVRRGRRLLEPGVRISLQWLTFDLLQPDGTGNRAIARASASSMLTMVGIVILLVPLIVRTWRDQRRQLMNPEQPRADSRPRARAARGVGLSSRSGSHCRLLPPGLDRGDVRSSCRSTPSRRTSGSSCPGRARCRGGRLVAPRPRARLATARRDLPRRAAVRSVLARVLAFCAGPPLGWSLAGPRRRPCCAGVVVLRHAGAAAGARRRRSNRRRSALLRSRSSASPAGTIVAVWVDHGFTRNFINSMIVTRRRHGLPDGRHARGLRAGADNSSLAFWLLITALDLPRAASFGAGDGYLPAFISSRES